MARPIEDELKDLLESGEVTEVQGNKFNKRVRNVDQDPLDVDDVFTIPNDYRVLEAPLVTGGDPVQFILVTVKNKATGVTRNMRFFPNQLAKTIYPIVDGKRQPKLKTGGTAALEYQTYADQGTEGMDNAVKALVGRPIVVSSKTPYTTFRFGTTEETSTNLFTYDFE